MVGGQLDGVGDVDGVCVGQEVADGLGQVQTQIGHMVGPNQLVQQSQPRHTVGTQNSDILIRISGCLQCPLDVGDQVFCILVQLLDDECPAVLSGCFNLMGHNIGQEGPHRSLMLAPVLLQHRHAHPTHILQLLPPHLMEHLYVPGHQLVPLLPPGHQLVVVLELPLTGEE